MIPLEQHLYNCFCEATLEETGQTLPAWGTLPDLEKLIWRITAETFEM